jgi:hypothetical protein
MPVPAARQLPEDTPATGDAPLRRLVETVAAPPPDRLRRGPRALLLLVWFALPFLVYVANVRGGTSHDSDPASLIPITLLLDGTVLLDRFAAEERAGPVPPYWLSQTPLGTASVYPIATGILATPVLALPILLQQWSRPLSPAAWHELAVGSYQSVAAAFIAALSVALFWDVCRRLGFAPWLRAGLTLLFAYGSETMAVASQALWQHGPGALMLLGGIAALLALPRRPRAAAVWLGICLGMAVAVRPTNLLLVAPLGLLALWRAPRQAILAGIVAAIVLAPFLAYNLTLFGTLFGGYGDGMPWPGLRPYLAGLAGLLVSPARGLLLYFPASLLALVLLARRREARRDGLTLALTAGVLLQIAVVSAWPMWWGGSCFGPRLLSETQAPILLLLGLAFPAEGAARRRGAIALAAVLAFSVAVQAVGAYSWPAIFWNGGPVNVDQQPSRLWDVADNPVFRGLFGMPAQP